MSGKQMRVYEAARQLGTSSRDLLQQLKQRGVHLQSHMSVISRDMLNALKREGAGESEPISIAVRLSDDGVDALARLPGNRSAYTTVGALFEGGKVLHCYIRLLGEGRQGDKRLEILVAADVVHPQNTAAIDYLRGTSLALLGYLNAGTGQFLVSGARSVPVNQAVSDGLSISTPIVFTTGSTRATGAQAIPAELMARLESLPTPKQFHLSVQERTGDWHSYLNVLERLAEEKEWRIRYDGFRSGRKAGHFVFALTENADWERIRASIGETVYLQHLDDSQGADGNGSDIALDELGTLVRLDAVRRRATVSLRDEFLTRFDDLDRLIPRKGLLSYSSRMDQVAIRRLKNGLERLARGRANNPRLATFLFDAGAARTEPRPLPGTDDGEASHFLRNDLNELQQEAVTKALGSQDLYLIKGPPGTGKTTVIAELCYRLARAGQRVLIASQANLAVDNALTKLIHDPHIRALRHGRDGSIEDEGKPFLESEVVDKWLKDTAADCRRRWAARREYLAAREPLQELSATLHGLIDARHALRALEYEAKRIVGRLTDAQQDVAAAEEEQREHRRRLDDMVMLLDWVQTAIETRDDIFRKNEADLSVPWSQVGGETLDEFLASHLDRVPRLAVYEEEVRNFYRSFSQLVGLGPSRTMTYRHGPRAEVLAPMELFLFHLRLLVAATTVSHVHRSHGATLDSMEANLENYMQLMARLRDAKLQEPHRAFGGWDEPPDRDRDGGLSSSAAALRRIIGEAAAAFPSNFPYLAELGALAERCLGSGRREQLLEQWRALRREMVSLLNSVDTPPRVDTFVAILGELRADIEQMCAIADARVEAARSAVEAIELEAGDLQRELASHLSVMEDQTDTLSRVRQRLAGAANDEALRGILQRLETGFSNEDLMKLHDSVAQMLKDDDELLFAKRFGELAEEWIEQLESGESKAHGELRQLYVRHANVIGTTCSRAGSFRFREDYGTFDVVIVDEVSKATPPELVLPLLLGERCILIGDDRQLPPMLGHNTIRELADELEVPQDQLSHLESSLFAELWADAPDALKTMLQVQYRMHDDIMAVINQFYEEKLQSGLKDPDGQRAHGLDVPWLGSGTHMAWITTPGLGPYREKAAGTSWYNESEAHIVRNVLFELNQQWRAKTAAGMPRKQVGVISFYGAQVRLLSDLWAESRQELDALDVRIGSVDRFQGMERPVVIVSMVRNNVKGDVGFAASPERINVALSRAQELLILVGSAELFTHGSRAGSRAIYGRVLDTMRERGVVVDVSHFGLD